MKSAMIGLVLLASLVTKSLHATPLLSSNLGSASTCALPIHLKSAHVQATKLTRCQPRPVTLQALQRWLKFGQAARTVMDLLHHVLIWHVLKEPTHTDHERCLAGLQWVDNLTNAWSTASWKGVLTSGTERASHDETIACHPLPFAPTQRRDDPFREHLTPLRG